MGTRRRDAVPELRKVQTVEVFQTIFTSVDKVSFKTESFTVSIRKLLEDCLETRRDLTKM